MSLKFKEAFDKVAKELESMSPEKFGQMLDHMEATEENVYDRSGQFGSFGHDIMEMESPGHYDNTGERLYMGSYSRHGNGD